MKRFLFASFSIVIFLAVFTNCKNNDKNYQTDAESQMTYVSSDDKEMNEAIIKAKANFSKFEKALDENSKKKKYVDLMVKQGFGTADGGEEHMWITDIIVKNKKLEGVLSNTPSMGSTLKQGDKVVVNKKQISDWVYTDIETGDIHGGYTMQVLRKHMTAEDGEAFDKEWGVNFVDK